VNADVRKYVVNTDKSLTLVEVNTTHVGKQMSTKAIGSSDRHDVTDQYKFEEGSSSERAALLGKDQTYHSDKNPTILYLNFTKFLEDCITFY
jgi:hypothetical protein